MGHGETRSQYPAAGSKGLTRPGNHGVEHAHSAASKCHQCKKCIAKNEVRFYKKVTYNNESGGIKRFYHPNCLFSRFARARVSASVINSVNDIEGFCNMPESTQKEITTLVERHKREGLPDHVSRSKIRTAASGNFSTVDASQKKRTAFKNPCISVLYTNADELTAAKVSELKAQAMK